MALSAQTIRPGFLVSLRTSLRGNRTYLRTELEPGEQSLSAAERVEVWQTEKRTADPEEMERASKAQGKASTLIRGVCIKSGFGLLCPEADEAKLEEAIAAAQEVVREFNKSAALTSIGIYVMTGRIMPDDVRAVKELNREIRQLMGSMQNGVENADADAIREAASRVAGLGNMMGVEGQTKVEMAVKLARSTARDLTKQAKEKGPSATLSVDKATAKRIGELRMSFLDLEEAEEIAAPKAKARAVDLNDAA